MISHGLVECSHTTYVVLKFRDKAPLFDSFLLNVKKKKKILPIRRTKRHRPMHVLPCGGFELCHEEFLYSNLARLLNNIRSYGSNVAGGFRRSNVGLVLAFAPV